MTRLSRIRGLALVATLATGMGIGYALGAQPNMQVALRSLQSALGSLQAATPNKGGHRERAIGLVNQAIAETEAGVAYAGD